MLQKQNSFVRVLRDGLKATVLIAEVVKVRIRVVGGRVMGIHFRDRPDAVGFGIRQRAQQNSVHNAEDRRRRADAECQRDDRDSGKAGTLAQHAQAIANVLKQDLHRQSPGLAESDNEVMAIRLPMSGKR